MRKLVSLCVVALLTVTSFGQISEGKAKYKMDFNSSDPAVQAQLGMLSGSTLTMYFSPEFTRTEMNMGMFMNTTTILNLKTKNGVTLMDGMMGKKAINMDDFEKMNDLQGEDIPEVEVEKTEETKKIAGYKCTKYIITTEEGVVNYWATEELTASVNGVKYMNEKVKGFPLEFEVSAQGMVMKFSATEVLSNLKGENKKELFNTAIPEGYEIVKAEDLQKMGM